MGRRALSWGLLGLALALVGCVPSTRPPSRQPAPRPSADIRQCLAGLARAKAEFTPLPDKYLPGGCQAAGTVKLLAVGIPITNLGAMTCRLALPFSGWVRDAVQQAARAWLDAPVVKIESFGTYSCRPIDGMAGKKLSEHAFANAVDIAAFQLSNGKRITVLDGWRGGDENVRNFLRAVFKAGCRRFAVSLSPDSDRFHQNHLHFDMGPSGPYCR